MEKRGLTFKKGERLRHKTLVDGLYLEGKAFYDFPLRLTWRVVSREELAESFRDTVPETIDRLQMMVTVPKKKRRHAVDRVLLRRRIREAYRLNRLKLKETLAKHPEIGTLSLGFVYIHTENADYRLIERKMIKLLAKVGDAIEKGRYEGNDAQK